MENRMITTKNAPSAIGPYSQAVRAGNLLYISGQIPVDPRTGEIDRADVRAQTKQSMENIGGILGACDLTFEDVVKTTIFLVDMEQFGFVNEVYGSYFGEYRPARACVEVRRLPKDVMVEIEAIASIREK